MLSWGVKIGSIFSLWSVSVSSIVFSKYSAEDHLSGRFVLGNYEGYMDPDLANESGVALDYFDYDHIVAEKFRSGIYDAAIVSTSVLMDLKEQNLLQEIDWTKLGITSVTSKDNAKDQFTETVQSILGGSEDFLKYGIPYFLNKLSFCYTGNEITSLNSKVSWKTLIEEVSKHSNFRSSSRRPNLAMIDDPRTILSMSKLVKGDSGVNLSAGDSISEIYSSLKNNGLNSEKLGNNFLLMSPSSATIVDALASGSIRGGFMYNGDCLYAANGGNLGKKQTKDKFHVVETDKDIYFLDFMVFSKKLSGQKLTKAYDFAKDLMFKDQNSDNLLEKEGEKYKHKLIRNFDFVQYTPVLKKVEEKVDGNNSYFQSSDDLCNVKKKILKINKPSNDASNDASNFYEKSIDDKKKSDLFIEFEKFKLSL